MDELETMYDNIHTRIVNLLHEEESTIIRGDRAEVNRDSYMYGFHEGKARAFQIAENILDQEFYKLRPLNGTCCEGEPVPTEG